MAAIAKALKEATLAHKLAKAEFQKDPSLCNSAYVESGCNLIRAIHNRDQFVAARRAKFDAMRQVFVDLRRGDGRGIQKFCLDSRSIPELVKWGQCMRDLGGVLVGKTAALCNKPIAAFLGMISILRDHGHAVVVRFMEKQLRAWIRETPRADWNQFLIHPVTRDVAVRLRVVDNVGLFSNLKKMGIGRVYTERGRGKIVSCKEDVFVVRLEEGGSVDVKRSAFYFDALPF